MEISERPEFVKAMESMSGTFRQEVTAPMLDGYWAALKHLPIRDFGVAVAECLKSAKFMPVPAEILERCAGPIALRAAAAWGEVADWCWRGGHDLKDPVANRVVALLGGWKVLGGESSKEFHTWTRKEFLRIYEELAGNRAAMDALEAGDADMGLGIDEVAEKLRLLE